MRLETGCNSTMPPFVQRTIGREKSSLQMPWWNDQMGRIFYLPELFFGVYERVTSEQENRKEQDTNPVQALSAAFHLQRARKSGRRRPK
jgi:hypothetical protein